MFPILDEWATVSALQAGASLSRFGDGELTLIRGSSIPFQRGSKELRRRLREVLKNTTIPVGLPHVFDESRNRELTCSAEYIEYVRSYRKLAVEGVTYYSSLISRLKELPWLERQDYKDHLFKIWEGRSVILVKGKDNRIDLKKIFSGAEGVVVVEGPDANAFDSYDDMLKEFDCFSREQVVIASLGPTATVLSYDLAQKGFQAIDLGSFWRFM